MTEIETYAKTNLSAEVLVIEGTKMKNESPQLTTYDKAVIYKYSDDGFKDINEELRISKGKTFSDFARHLKGPLGNYLTMMVLCIEKFI